MANFVKAKAGISSLCLLMMVIVYGLDTGWPHERKVTRWGTQLTWNDFVGYAPPFTRYHAGIESKIFIETDPSSGRSVAYAGQINTRSWVKDPDSSDLYLMEHEMYHFHITEVHARLLNRYIKDNSDDNIEVYTNVTIRPTLARMQTVYDAETNHSLNQDIQHHWEYQIDSMLAVNDTISIQPWYAHSGALVFFPSTPEPDEQSNEAGRVRSYKLLKYNMALAFEEIKDNRPPVGSKTPSVETDMDILMASVPMDELKLSYTKDTSGLRSHYLWSRRLNSLYMVRAAYRAVGSDTIGYHRIAKSFISTFRYLHIKD